MEQETNETGLEADVENLALRTRDRNAAMKTKGQQLSKPRKRGRSSLQDLAPSDTNNKFTKPTKSDKAPRRQKPDEPTEETEETTNAPKGKKKRQTRLSLEDRIATLRRQSEVQKPTISANEQDDTEQAEGRKKRQRRSSQQEVLGAQLPLKSCLHVAPRVRGIKQSTIDAKWTPLGSPSIAIATETLELAHHPILQRMSNTTGRREHTSAALALLYKRITRKLHRGLPFPPAGMSSNRGDGGRETELDFESVLLGKQALEKQLDPALGAVEVLRREKQRVERELERDYKTLRNLEAGAKGQAREQRELLKKAHVLAPDAMASVKQDLELSFGNKGSVPPGALFKVRHPYPRSFAGRLTKSDIGHRGRRNKRSGSAARRPFGQYEDESSTDRGSYTPVGEKQGCFTTSASPALGSGIV